MISKRDFKKLNQLVKEHGWAKVASMLGERDTQSLKRWLKRGEVPEYKKNTIKVYLDRGIKL